MITFAAPVISGRRVSIAPATEHDLVEIADLDWRRSLHPAMGGWWARPSGAPGPGTVVLRRGDAPDGEIVGTLDARELLGYPGVINLSMFTDDSRARGGMALEGYALTVDTLFAQGARLIHHEVITLNRPILRLMRALRIERTAHLREHAYAAGRWWDVAVFSFDREVWRSILDRMPNNPVDSLEATPTDVQHSAPQR